MKEGLGKPEQQFFPLFSLFFCSIVHVYLLLVYFH